MNPVVDNRYQPPRAPLEQPLPVRAVSVRFWYGYLLVLIGLSVVNYVISFTNPFSPGTIQATLVLGACLLSLTPVAGFATQRRLAFRWVWMLLFCLALLVYCGLALITALDPSPRRLMVLIGGSIMLAPYLYAAFSYAFRCSNLWATSPAKQIDSSGTDA